jgi:hypothetical protein
MMATLCVRIALMSLALLFISQIAQLKVRFLHTPNYPTDVQNWASVGMRYQSELCRYRDDLSEWSQDTFDSLNLEAVCYELTLKYELVRITESIELALTGLYDGGAIISSQLLRPVSPNNEDGYYFIRDANHIYPNFVYFTSYTPFIYRVLASAGATILLYIALAWGVMRMAQAYTVRRGMFAPS